MLRSTALGKFHVAPGCSTETGRDGSAKIWLKFGVSSKEFDISFIKSFPLEPSGIVVIESTSTGLSDVIAAAIIKLPAEKVILILSLLTSDWSLNIERIFSRISSLRTGLLLSELKSTLFTTTSITTVIWVGASVGDGVRRSLQHSSVFCAHSLSLQ